MAASKNLSPEERSERARKAGEASAVKPDRWVTGLENRASLLTQDHLQRLERVILVRRRQLL